MKIIPFCILASLLVASAAEPPPLIPQPVKVETGNGEFIFSVTSGICHDPLFTEEAELFAADLEKLTGRKPQVVTQEMKTFLPSEILLELDKSLDLPASGYHLNVSAHSVKITAKDKAGAYYGTRTLLQLLPAGNAKTWDDTQSATVPSLKITDYPRFDWRGMMLDSGRHIQPVTDIKRFIDWMAFHKLNVFHWHLTEDQGWRIEIKQYPKLTEVGAFRESSPPYGNRKADDGVRYGGFYTQEQIKEIVAYATARHINVVPEIELPGHAAAAIASYPELGNSDIPGYSPKVVTRWGMQSYTFAPKEETFRFLEDVLTEVCALFPSKFIHIGCDEAPKDQWNQSKFAQDLMKQEKLKDAEALQSWFIRRIEKFLESKGRSIIGWDEIQEGGLSKTATMMVWRDEMWGKHALALGNNVVMAAMTHTYFDHYQNPEAQELAKGNEYEAICCLLPLDKVYSYDPASIAENPAQKKQILGTQAQLWSEYFKEFKKVEYHAFPRMAALAEVAWTRLDAKNYDQFSKRLVGVMKHYDAGKLNYSKPSAQ